MREHFGEVDAIIDAKAVLGKAMLSTEEDYKTLAIEVYSAIVQHQNAHIHLVLSGPIGLAAVIGRLIGTHAFNVTIYQFVPGEGYVPMPTPNIDWKALV
jgi:methylglyoxal synthase